MADAPFQSVTIIGFGLIGASLAAALKQRDPKVRVIAADLPSTLSNKSVVALSDEQCDATDAGVLGAAMRRTELTVLAAPVNTIVHLLPQALEAAALVTDCGSTKRSIVQQAQRIGNSGHFVPGHPMAGLPSGGADAATPALFEQRRWILCPNAVAPLALERVAHLVQFVGAECVTMDADDHDRAVAVTSHVPQLFASLLAVYAHRMNAEVAAGPGFTSATRVAGGNLAMWRDIFSSNADAVSRVILDLAADLEQLGRALDQGQLEPIEEVLKNARQLRSRMARDGS
jgi:prephenate dehydrogenase